MDRLDAQAIEEIAVGAAVLGAGGGGDPYLGKLMALAAIEQYGPVPCIEPEKLKDDDIVIPLSMIGAPTVVVEKIPSGRECGQAFAMVERWCGQSAQATMPIEIGGVNSLIPIVVAAQRGIPVVDADGMGRAFPEMQMDTFHLAGIRPYPVSLVDEKGNRMLFETENGWWLEALMRSATVTMGGSAATAGFPVTGEQVKKHAIPKTLTLARRIGRVLLQARRSSRDPVEQLLEATGGWLLFRGKAVDVKRRTDGGFAKGTARFAGTGEWQGSEWHLHFQNEFLVAEKEGVPVATTPDLIAVLDTETGMPFTTESLRYGIRAAVIAMPCHPAWRTEKGIETVGPRHFGYDLDYIPVEQRLGGGRP
jgi:DUF917 family protein